MKIFQRMLNIRITVITFIILLSMLFLAQSVQAEECPQGASDCYLCGGEIPCTKDCVGVLNPITETYMSCECPQGEACTCYCPYIDTECATGSDCASESKPELQDAAAYVTEFTGNPEIIKKGAQDSMPLTESTIIEYGDTLVIGLDESAFVVFDGGNSRGYFGEAYITINEIENHTQLEGEGIFWIVNLASRAYGELEDNRNQQKAVTVCGIGDYDKGLEASRGEVYECDIEFTVESEAVFDMYNNSYLVKVLEGKVTAKNKFDDQVIINSNEQLTISGPITLANAEKKVYDYSSDDLWWTESFEGVECDEKCSSNQRQTPYPGCSCTLLAGDTVSDTDQDSDTAESSEDDEILGGLYDPTVICCAFICLIVVGVIGVIAVVVFVLARKKKGKK